LAGLVGWTILRCTRASWCPVGPIISIRSFETVSPAEMPGRHLGTVARAGGTHIAVNGDGHTDLGGCSRTATERGGLIPVSTPPETERLLARAGEIAKQEMGRLLERSPGSAELHARAVRALPAGVASNFQAGDPYPIYLSHAKGPHVWDVDGLDYLDFHGG